MWGVRGRQGVWSGDTCPSWSQGPAGSQCTLTGRWGCCLEALSASPNHLHPGRELPGPTGSYSLHQLWQSEVSEKESWWLAP